MRILTINEYTAISVSGGISTENQMIIRVGIGLMGGITSAAIVDYLVSSTFAVNAALLIGGVGSGYWIHRQMNR